MHTNQRLLVDELVRRGAEVRVVDASIELIEARFRGSSELILDRAGTAVSHVASVLAADKHLTKLVLREAGLNAPEGALFDPSQIDEALDYADALGYPVAAKPNVGSGGRGARSAISGRDALEAAICSLLLEVGSRERFIVERHVPGSEFRIFITVRGGFAVLLREPARVIGDGRSTIEELAEAESARRLEAKAQSGSALCPIALDDGVLEFLISKGRGPRSVPARGEHVALRLCSNLSQGGSSTDMTDEAHGSAIEIARRALAAFPGLPCLGVDFIARSVSEEAGPANPYAIIEVNANPGLAMHHYPASGRPRDAAGLLAEAMFERLFAD